MKKLLLILLCLPLIFSTCKKEEDVPTPNSNTGNSNTGNTTTGLVGYLIDYYDQLYKTTDGGATWILQGSVSIEVNSNYDVHQMDFVDENTGYVLGSSQGLYYLLKTSNSGVSWTKMKSQSYDDVISFTDHNSGVMASNSSGSTYVTNSSGTSWGSGDVQSYFSGTVTWLDFVNSKTAYYMIGGKIYRTTNLNQNQDVTWTQKGEYIGSDIVIDFVNQNPEVGVASTGYYVIPDHTSGGSVYKTTNSGTTWTHQANYTGNTHIRDIDFVNDTTGYYAISQFIYKTTDSGVTWVQQGGVNNSIYHIDFLN